MSDSLSKHDRTQVAEGLRMTDPPDPAGLAAERRALAELEGAGFVRRTRAYMKLIGPGYMQSAMTLGGGTAAASLFAGALFGYQLLWVAPVAMILGVVMLSAVSYQTLSTGVRPFEAMRRFAGAPFAWGWAIGALLSSIIWHFPQYSLASAVLVDMGDVMGFEGLQPGMMGFVVLAWAIVFSMMYGTSPTLVRWYERILKYMVWGIVLCFGLVVVKTGIADWGELAAGFIPFRIPGEANGVAGLTIVVSGLAAAVGVNMLFLYPYSLLARGWDREHRRLARFDLYMGMLLPYVLATSLMVIAMANTIHLDEGFVASRLTPVQAAQSLAAVVGDTWGRVVFNLGVLGMVLSSITLQMLCTGFVCVELFGWKFGSVRYRLATLLPVPGVLGSVYWAKVAVWLAIPTNIVCGLFLPLAYVGFILLQRNRKYLGDDTPSGGKGRAWIGAMVFATLILTAFLGWYLITKGPEYLDMLTNSASGD
ncbi:MAG: hypothetical protein E2O39_07315 [Planctomycetota bacterium]|nr:MAG: hypothetical protein E2O39_07315 [Planctomycetota bacterium]